MCTYMHVHPVYHGHHRADWFLELTKGCSVEGSGWVPAPWSQHPAYPYPTEKQFKRKLQITCVET